MATESAPPAKRPSPLLLALLGLTVAAAAAMKLMGSASPGTPASNPSTAARPAAATRPDASGRKGGPIDPAALDVHLEVLEAARPAAAEAERNPFRFRPPPAPPAPPPMASRPAPEPVMPSVPAGPPPPPPPPPITVKFIGLIDRADGSRMAVFTDCSAGRRQSLAREGATVDGRYRLVKIGRESVIIEHLDGRGRTTLAAGGQECVK
jgi:hypothetical protein